MVDQVLDIQSFTNGVILASSFSAHSPNECNPRAAIVGIIVGAAVMLYGQVLDCRCRGNGMC